MNAGMDNLSMQGRKNQKNEPYDHIKGKSSACQSKGYKNVEHSKHGRFCCPEESCSRTFTKISHLREHVCSHFNNLIKRKLSPSMTIQKFLEEHEFKKYQCEKCSLIYLRMSHLQNHYHTIHRTETLFGIGNSEGYEKNDCSKVFPSRAALNRHICYHVNQYLTNKEEYSEEIKDYLEEHPFQFFSCSICEKIFTLDIECQHHLRRHSKKETLPNYNDPKGCPDAYNSSK